MIRRRNYAWVSSGSFCVLLMFTFGLVLFGYLFMMSFQLSQDQEISVRFESHEKKTFHQRDYNITVLVRKLKEYEKEISNMKRYETLVRQRLTEKENEINRRDKENNSIERLSQALVSITKTVDRILAMQSQTKPTKHEQKAHITNLEDVKKCNNPLVLFVVTSHSSNVDRRQTIRKTWGNKDRFRALLNKVNVTYDVYFSIGTGKNGAMEKAKMESRENGDILIIDRQEDFYDLTRRVMAAFQWSAEACNNTYLFKVDDDVFVNIPNTIKFLMNHSYIGYKDNLYAGDMNTNAFVLRDRRSKYFVGYDEWPVETYPPYCSGGGFIISRAIITKIIPFYDWVNPYKIDDAYIGILVQRARIRNIILYEPSNKFEFWFYSSPKSCRFHKNSIVYHKVTKDTCMIDMTLQSTNQIGKAMKTITEFKKRPPPLNQLPKAALPKGMKFVPKVEMISNIEENEV